VGCVLLCSGFWATCCLYMSGGRLALCAEHKWWHSASCSLMLYRRQASSALQSAWQLGGCFVHTIEQAVFQCSWCCCAPETA
jgi:hypothetical protein